MKKLHWRLSESGGSIWGTAISRRIQKPTEEADKNDVRGAHKGRKFEKRRRTKPKCSNGIRARGLKEQLHLRRERTANEALIQTRPGDRKVNSRVFHHCRERVGGYYGGADHLPKERRVSEGTGEGKVSPEQCFTRGLESCRFALLLLSLQE